ncbi:hypothetical protein LTR42_002811 [Elasticomyces elasticus]|nr:hypothetical protein LTR42_002811 [Elasticomyces elasticus]
MSDDATAAALAGFGNPTQAPPWPDHNQGPLLNRVIWTLLAISGLVAAARLWTKWRKTRRLYWDDGLIILAWLLGLAHATQMARAVQHGLGRHMLYIDNPQREIVIRLGVWALMCAYLSPMVGRIAFCVTIYYLTATDSRIPKWPIWVIVAGQLLVRNGHKGETAIMTVLIVSQVNV